MTTFRVSFSRPETEYVELDELAEDAYQQYLESNDPEDWDYFTKLLGEQCYANGNGFGGIREAWEDYE